MLKKTLIEVAVCLLALAAIASCDKAFASHEETAEAAKQGKIQAARCYVYENYGEKRKEALRVFRKHIGHIDPLVTYNLGYADGQVNTLASQHYYGTTHAAKLLFKEAQCAPWESI